MSSFIFAVVFQVSFPRQLGVFLLLLARPQVTSGKRTLRPDMCVVSSFWCVMFDVCCCLSSVLSPTVGCVSVAVGAATSRVGQTDTEARYVLCFAIWAHYV